MNTSHLAALCFTCLLIIIPITASAQPYVISADGGEVTDQKTGLVWRRCAEGMQVINNTCAGVAATYTHDQVLAVSAATQGIWRLPNIKELSSIADKSLSSPAIDAVAFSATPAGLFWSSSPWVKNTAWVWSVNFNNGEGDLNLRTNTGYVRLVRAGQ